MFFQPTHSECYRLATVIVQSSMYLDIHVTQIAFLDKLSWRRLNTGFVTQSIKSSSFIMKVEWEYTAPNKQCKVCHSLQIKSVLNDHVLAFGDVGQKNYDIVENIVLEESNMSSRKEEYRFKKKTLVNFQHRRRWGSNHESYFVLNDCLMPMWDRQPYSPCRICKSRK